MRAKRLFTVAFAAVAVLLLAAPDARAQSSASFKLEQHSFNAGGRPENGSVATSANFRVTLDAIGSSVALQGGSAPSYRLGAGIVNAHRPPGEITDLVFDDKQTLRWDADPSVGVYNLYRGAFGALGGGGYGSCSQMDLTAPGTTDTANVPVGGGYFYLATAKNRLAEEGTRGYDHAGTERTGAVCP